MTKTTEPNGIGLNADESERALKPNGPPVQLPTPGRGLAWLLLFVALFYGAAVVYAGIQGAYLGFIQPDLVENSAVLESMIFESMESPSGLAWVARLQFVLLVPVVLWASHFPAQPWRDTLALHHVTGRLLGFWMLIYCAYFVAQGLLNLLAPIDHGELIHSLTGSRHLGVFLAFVFLTPVVEELVSAVICSGPGGIPGWGSGAPYC